MVDGSSQAYDVVIIGAGIGGLVCGCYPCKSRNEGAHRRAAP